VKKKFLAHYEQLLESVFLSFQKKVNKSQTKFEKYSFTGENQVILEQKI
jgi:hypothetical protein